MQKTPMIDSKAVRELREITSRWNDGRMFTHDADIIRKCAAVCEDWCGIRPTTSIGRCLPCDIANRILSVLKEIEL